MRPFLIPQVDEWVDLDTVQSMRLEFHGTKDFAERAAICWRHAFQNAERQAFVYCLDEEFDTTKEPPQDPLVGPDGRTIFAARVEDEIFGPFFNAWTRKSE